MVVEEVDWYILSPFMSAVKSSFVMYSCGTASSHTLCQMPLQGV
jgi:hypothetical protein